MLYFHRPSNIHLTRDCANVSRQKRRRPLDKRMDVPFKIKLNLKKDNESVKSVLQNSSPAEVHVDEVDSVKEVNGKSEQNGRCINDHVDNENKSIKIEMVEESKKADKNENAIVLTKIEQSVQKFSAIKKLDQILKRLSEKVHEKLMLTNNIIPQNSSQVLNYSVSNHAPNVHHYHHHHQQHVSPRKRILREFEKVSLEDQVLKRSRPKPSLNNNGNTVVTATISSPIPLTKVSNRNNIISKSIATSTASLKSTSNLNNNLNNNNNNDDCDSNTNSTIKAHNNKPARRPFSSYSITSLLGHNSNDNNNHNDSKNSNNNVQCSSNDLISSTSHQRHSHYQHLQMSNKESKESDEMHSQRLSLNSQQLIQEYGSSSSAMFKALNQSNHNNINFNNSNNKHKSPTSASVTPPYTTTVGDTMNSSTPTTIRSPDMSPSPEHHAFQKYRPQHVTPTPPTSSPFSYYQQSLSLVPSPNYIRRTPSPLESSSSKNRIRTTFKCESPSSVLTGQSPQSTKRNYPVARSHSPPFHYSQQTSSPFSGHHSKSRRSPSNFHENDSLQSTSSDMNVRAGLKNPCTQQFDLTTSSATTNSNDSNSAKNNILKDDKSTKRKNEGMDFDNQSLIRPSALIAPPPPLPLHYYMYPPHAGYVQNPFYNSLYNPSIAAAAAVAYSRSSVYMQLPHTTSVTSSNSTSISSNRNSLISSQQNNNHATYVPTSPWNPIPLTAHSIDDGNLMDKIRDETSPGNYACYF